MNISVIIPTNKPQSYLCKCLESLSDQTFPKENFEIIIILNGDIISYDSFVKKTIDEHLRNHNVVYLTSEHANVSISRNLGIEYANGEFITFVDDDDYVSPNFLEEMYNIARNDMLPLSNVIAFDDLSLNEISNSLGKLFVKYNANPTLLNVRTFFSNPVGKLLSRKIINSSRFNPKYSLGEDGLFMLELSPRINSLCFTSEKAVYYRRVRAGSATTTKRTRIGMVCNSLSLIKAYLFVLFKNPFRVNWLFLFTRILAEVICILKILIDK